LGRFGRHQGWRWLPRAVGDGPLGFWKAVSKKWPQRAQQICSVHKTALHEFGWPRHARLAFYDFSAVHWQHIRTTNPIESMFSAVRLTARKTKNCGNRMTTLAMAWKLMETAQNK